MESTEIPQIIQKEELILNKYQRLRLAVYPKDIPRYSRAIQIGLVHALYLNPKSIWGIFQRSVVMKSRCMQVRGKLFFTSESGVFGRRGIILNSTPHIKFGNYTLRASKQLTGGINIPSKTLSIKIRQSILPRNF